MKPATKLPWDQIAMAVFESHGEKKVAQCSSTADASYVRHACNAYPKLVEVLKEAIADLCNTGAPQDWIENYTQFLDELGEEA